MTAAVFTHPACTAHDPGPGNPEHPARLTVLLQALDEAGIDAQEATPADVTAITPVHSADYLRRLEAISDGGGGALSADTTMNQSTWAAILGATGAVTSAVDHAIGGGNAFAAVRPPGHHALGREAMGFCFVNNVVVAARLAQGRGANQVLIIDWDVHHGNGTQALIEHDPTIRFVSLHQWPWYPGTGAESERGVGNVFNVPRPPGLPAERYVRDLWHAVTLATDGWIPDMILISAGFDAMTGDPLGGFTLEAEDYADITTRLRTDLPSAPIVGLLEGGYIPDRIAEGALAHIEALGQ